MSEKNTKYNKKKASDKQPDLKSIVDRYKQTHEQLEKIFGEIDNNCDKEDKINECKCGGTEYVIFDDAHSIYYHSVYCAECGKRIEYLFEIQDGKDVFVHSTTLPTGTDINPDDPVEYTIEESELGPRATNVKIC